MENIELKYFYDGFISDNNRNIIVDLCNMTLKVISSDCSNKIDDNQKIINLEYLVLFIDEYIKNKKISSLFNQDNLLKIDGIMIKYNNKNIKHQLIISEIWQKLYKKYLSSMNETFESRHPSDIYLNTSEYFTSYSIANGRLLDTDHTDQMIFLISINPKLDDDNLKETIIGLINSSNNIIEVNEIANYFSDCGYLIKIDDIRLYYDKNKHFKWINYIIENHNSLIINNQDKKRKLKMEE